MIFSKGIFFKSVLKHIKVIAGTLPKGSSPIYVKSCLAFPNLCARLKLALPGTTIGAITVEGILGGIGLKG
jgi:hypothetical protein